MKQYGVELKRAQLTLNRILHQYDMFLLQLCDPYEISCCIFPILEDHPMTAIPMSELMSIRNTIDIRASDIARGMGMTESTFSRFQQRETVELDDARRYLESCGFGATDD